MSRSRPRRVGDSFRAAAAHPRTTETAPRTEATVPVVDAAVTTTRSRATGRATAKFTVLLSLDDAAAFDELAVTLRRLIGRRVTKGEIVRTLVALASDDATLRHDLAAELHEKPS